ncbi:MAG: DNA polymerase sliding clamp [Desulfurococcaceae archaeon]
MYALKLRFRDAVVWKYSIVAISKIIEEANFKATSDGIKLRAMDPSAVVLVDFYIPSSAFYEYDISGDVVIGLNMEELAKMLRRARKGDELVLEVLPGGRIGISLEGRGFRRFVLSSIELSYEEPPEISFEETFTGKILPKLFKDVIKELEPISDTIEFYAPPDEGKLILRAESEIAEAQIELSSASGALIEYTSTSEAKSKYTLDYFVDIVAASQVAETLSLGFGVETPIRLTYELPLGGKLEFYVAPRTD